ncbi:MAG: UPF0149 family protein [Gammaproteobacteria bacterium]|nr:UPF0149 family protein [Gammaproteobacteria bacterium]
MVSYRELEDWAAGQVVDQPPAEIHGLLTGWLCAGASWDKAGRLMAISEWLDVELGKEDFALLEALYNETAEGVLDEEFGFRLLVPDDDRAGEYSHPGGFLVVLGLSLWLWYDGQIR